MNKKLFFPVILVVALVFTFTAAGCDNGSTSDSDIWSEVTSLDQLNGTWKGVYNQGSMPIKDFLEEEDMWDDSMGQTLGDIKVSVKVAIVLTINSTQKTQAMAMTMTTTFSGGNINIVWPMLKMGFGSIDEEGMSVSFNDATHSMIMTLTNPPETMSDDEINNTLNSGLLINQSGRKIKIVPDSLESGMPEMILVKQ